MLEIPLSIASVVVKLWCVLSVIFPTPFPLTRHRRRSARSASSRSRIPAAAAPFIMTEAEVYRKEPGEQSFGTKSSLPPLNMQVAANSSPAKCW